jgi:hypothetical protein
MDQEVPNKKPTNGQIDPNDPIAIIADRITEAHTNIQKDFEDINPVVGVSRKMRSVGIPADAMTIDCLKTQRRIIIIAHDSAPELIQFQFSFKNVDPSDDFESILLHELTASKMYEWIRDYFTKAIN